MERNTQIGIGLVVLAVLAGGVYYKAKQDAQIGTSQTTAADMPQLKAEDPDKIVVTNADKPEVVLEKKGDKWELTKPVNAPANQTNVKSVVDNLKELKATELILSSPTEEQKKDYLFEPGKAVHVVVYKGADKKLDATFGKSGARGQLAMVEGKPGIYAVSGYSSYLYTREPKGWRDAEIFKFDDTNATNLTIAKKDGTLSFTKGDKGWAGTFKDKPIADLDEEKVKDAIRAFKSLNAEDFGDGKTTKDTGLDEPQSTVTVQLKDNAGKYVLKVGNVSTGTSHYVQKEGDPTIFVIPQYSSDWALADEHKFQKPQDGGTDGGTKKAEPKKDGGK